MGNNPLTEEQKERIKNTVFPRDARIVNSQEQFALLQAAAVIYAAGGIGIHDAVLAAVSIFRECSLGTVNAAELNFKPLDSPGIHENTK